MSRIFITMGSAYSKAANVNPVDGIWCSDCGWAGRVEEDMTDSEESEEGQGVGGLTDGKERRLHGKAF